MTGPTGTHWDYGYDQRGRQTSATDPDRGTTTTTYDDSGRVTTQHRRPGGQAGVQLRRAEPQDRPVSHSTSGTRLAGWTYDGSILPDGTLAKALPTSSTRYDGAAAYTTSVLAYTDQYQPTATMVSIPSTETGLAGDYMFQTAYNVDGSVNSVDIRPRESGARGGVHVYTSLGLANALSTFYDTQGLSSYVTATQYNALAEADPVHALPGTGGRVYQNRYTNWRPGDCPDHHGPRQRHPQHGAGPALQLQRRRQYHEDRRHAPVARFIRLPVLHLRLVGRRRQRLDTELRRLCRSTEQRGARRPGAVLAVVDLRPDGRRKQQVQHGTANGDATTTTSTARQPSRTCLPKRTLRTTRAPGPPATSTTPPATRSSGPASGERRSEPGLGQRRTPGLRHRHVRDR